MSSEKSGRGVYTFSCDSCPEVEEVETSGTVEDAWNELKEQGWTTFKMGPEWKHECPDCSEEQA